MKRMVRVFRPLPVYCCILAAVFLGQASATPVHSDRVVTSSKKTKLPNSMEQIVGDFESSQETEKSWNQWGEYFEHFWNYMYEQPCHDPIPSPSESPIPNGAGEFPDKVESTESQYGFNQESYKKFTLNEPFYVDVEEEVPAEIYDENKASIHILMKLAEHGSLNPKEAKKWKDVSNAILKCYRSEKGAIFFDVAFSQRWTFCGWIDMAKTFVKTEKHMRICASLLSLGMDDITRPPEEGKDFIVPGESDTQTIEKLLKPVLAISGRQILNKTVRNENEPVENEPVENEPIENEPVTVDLFYYPEYCDMPLDIDPNCYGFCCLTPYYGSEFCYDCGF